MEKEMELLYNIYTYFIEHVLKYKKLFFSNYSVKKWRW